ncbi:hypothetical protein COW36_13665 [bacterium (Candidatus Blackallbacteria) CG17_big_fil_post_rev_8_21_14_2_50_48_46]|uniref:Teneurin NHL domain-containing protein n=1 Tax=bacterium (Candidatus Blackallbacteria) CG17_big_fil_post_rev_8_21_14_2_50_48_46 TaxID=2014261 RepID=A0A2M7G3G7_9BACT|nr:MAG: hypothetical protein COW64_22285 [bacterium (Candidatus Blackallbacteria) CG18_big_fil_WC_8_21_14_2_50_49_26]PIW16372.1 MAG: hypothetical protein COW36_13665 [bacterium (Candidatus Blackallbacteria) CG17_big_fil_post_rev_8_21_14_2_50_48_46]PIW45385.1 MAG: hypothetical protein COW20_20900 [bacterium (Candidatus Blackallbacteria) CG13_big_fil_rev_8_21_14_2_50_49_14]
MNIEKFLTRTKKFRLFWGTIVITMISSCSSQNNTLDPAYRKEVFELVQPLGYAKNVKTNLRQANRVTISPVQVNQTIEEPYWLAMDREGSLYVTFGSLYREFTLGRINLKTSEFQNISTFGYVRKFGVQDEEPRTSFVRTLFFLYPLTFDASNSLIIVLDSNTSGSPIISRQIPYFAPSNKDNSATHLPSETLTTKTVVLKAEGQSVVLNKPQGIVIAENGIIYISDTGNNCIRKLENGILTTFAGSENGEFGNKDGQGTEARFYSPMGIAINPQGELYVADFSNSSLRKITPKGQVSTVNVPRSLTNPREQSLILSSPTGIAIDSEDALYISDSSKNQVYRLAPDRKSWQSLSGTSRQCGPSEECRGDLTYFTQPWGLTFDESGNLYVADKIHNMIRKISPRTAL